MGGFKRMGQGGAGTDKAGLSAGCLGMLSGIFPPFQNILGSSSARCSLQSAPWPLWSYTNFHEVFKREGELQADPPPLSPQRQQGADLNQQLRRL